METKNMNIIYKINFLLAFISCLIFINLNISWSNSDSMDEGDSTEVTELEIPDMPNLYSLGSITPKTEVTLRWKKVLDSHYKHNADYYIYQCSTERNSIADGEKVEINPFVPGENLYESLSHTVTQCNGQNLKDDTTYYFRVIAVNQLGYGYASVVRNTTIKVQDWPEFDESYQIPSNGAKNIDKTPVLRWRATDKDGDNLDYYVTFGEQIDKLYTKRAFSDQEHEGENEFNFATEYHKPLKPNTTYYWQIWVIEEGHYKDYYGGEYIKSPVWSFTTQNIGSDLTITNIEQVGEIKPDSEVLFKITVKNIGTETANTRIVESSYIKNGSESKFWTGSGNIQNKLEPGHEEVVEVKVKFRDSVDTIYDKIYDNVLVAGESKIKFYFAYEDEQDVDISNNEKEIIINYEDNSAPTVESFNIREYGQMYNSYSNLFWARAGKNLEIIINARDDLKIKQCIYEYRLHPNDNWIEIETINNNYDYYSELYEWPIPNNIHPSDEAQIRVSLYDDQNNEKIKVSELFSIYSSKISAKIEPVEPPFKVGNMLKYKVILDTDHAIQRISTRLYGGRSEEIYEDYNKDGMSLPTQFQWAIPNQNSYFSKNSYLKLNIEDIRGNSFEVFSNKFEISANQELPAPFNESIILYDNEIVFPENAIYGGQIQDIKYIKLDENNIVHAVIEHSYHYFQETASGYSPDTFTSVKNSYYIKYNPEDKSKSTIKITDINYEVIDFSLMNNKPYVLLKSTDGYQKIGYSYLSGSYFTSPKIILNNNIPKLSSVAHMSNTSEKEMSNPKRYAYVNDYLWELDICCRGTISKYPFSNGSIGNEDRFKLNNDPGSFESYRVDPVVDGNLLYFIDSSDSKLIKIDTSSLKSSVYDLPFTLGRTREYSYRTALAAKNGNLYIFGNGKIYSIDGNNIIEKGNISYSFNNETVDYSSEWNDIDYAKSFIADNKIYLLLGDFFHYSKPTWTRHELLEFDTNTYSLKKSVASTQSDFHFVSPKMNTYIYGRQNLDFMYMGNNKLLIAYGGNHGLFDYYAYGVFFQLLDIKTGSIIHLGEINSINGGNVSLAKQGSQVYAIVENNKSNSSDIYRLTFSNLTMEKNQYESPQLIEFNNKLFITWNYGNPYYGTWNNEKDRLNNNILRRNQFVEIYPSIGSVKNFSDEYFGRCNNVHNNYISSTLYGMLFSLNSDFTINNKILEEENNSYMNLKFKSFDSTYIAVFGKYISNKCDLTLYNNNFSNVSVKVDSQSNKVVTFEDEAIIVGYGLSQSPYKYKHVINKVDLITAQKGIIGIGQGDSSLNYNKVDINKNKYVAVAWNNFLAVADLSGDIIPPEIDITSSDGKITNGSNLIINWNAQDNRDELIKFEIYKISDNSSTLLDTINDVSQQSYNIDVNEVSNKKITYKVVAFDYDGNQNDDTIEFDIVVPVSIKSFSVNKSTVDIGENLLFIWDAQGADNSTAYTVYKRKIDSLDWDLYFSSIGETSKKIIVEGFIGEYEFMLKTEKDNMKLLQSVTIEGEIPEFNYSDFYPVENIIYFVDDKNINFSWGLEKSISDEIVYNLLIKTKDENKFSNVLSTDNSQANYSFPKNVNEFEWMINALYKGYSYSSKTYTCKINELYSPDIKELQLIRNHTSKPAVVISYDNNVEGIQTYAIYRRDSSGVYTEIAISNKGKYTDTTVTYDEYYEYNIYSVIDELKGKPGESDKIYVQIKELNDIIIHNQNHEQLDHIENTVSFSPMPELCFEKYEIKFGTQKDNLETYVITSERNVRFTNLENGKTYYVEIYPLDFYENRLSNIPATIDFISPPIEEITQKIPLQIGWNFLSFNINKCFFIKNHQPDPAISMIQDIEYSEVDSIDAILKSIEGKYSYVWGFDIEGVKTYNLTPLSDMRYMAAGYGYWIKINEDAYEENQGPLYIEFTGKPVDEKTNISMHNGWNMVGYLGNTIKWAKEKPNVLFPENSVLEYIGDDIGIVFNSIDGYYSYVRGFDGKAKSYNLTPLSDMKYVGPGYGYWIKVNCPEESINFSW